MEKSLLSFALEILLLESTTILCSATTIFNITTDQHALAALKNSITSDPSGFLAKNWSDNVSVCKWIGVSCGIKHHRVTALNISGFNLSGAVAPHLGNLTFLRSLDISSNKFTGEIPTWLGSLPRLEQLSLHDNSLSGNIPPSLFSNTKLQDLDVSSNLLGGNIPEEMGNLSSLKSVNLSYNAFSGTIPRGIFNISSLTTISIGFNSITGSLPSDICSNMLNIETLYLLGNQLSGEIPPNIWKCRHLKILGLSVNRFKGKIPSEIGSLSMLRELYLSINYFVGRIPRQIGNLTYLEYLYLSNNHLTGELPQELANLIHLEKLLLGNNSFSGMIPSSIFNISTLRYLELVLNQFSGSLPSNMGSTLFNLEILYLHSSGLGGPIPSSINNASKLLVLDMSNNLFSGSIPNFDNLRLLRTLFMWGNYLSGAKTPTQELEFLSSLTNCRHLLSVVISANPLNGHLPSSIGNLSESLATFDASECNIKGSIPSEIGNLSSLLDLYIYENELVGPLPTTIRKLEQLQRLALNDNLLQGHIPNEICDLNNLGDLYLDDNMFTSGIPQCFGDMKNLRYVHLGSNKLNSTIPSNLWNLRDLLTLNLSSNYLSGQLSSQIANLKAVIQIDLSSNMFSGDIPSSIGSCQSMEILSLSGNKFSGSIPQSLGNLKGLVRIDLSNNSLSGWIPKSLESLRFLEYINVSYNKLEGEIPNEGCFVNFTSQSFIHNSALCGIPRFQVPPCPESRRASRSKGVPLVKYIVPSLISAIILVIIALVLIVRSKRERLPLSVDTSLGIEWRRISYIELERGTSSFSEANLLGTGSYGSVFKAILPDGLNVAVKVFNLDLEQATKSFDTESEILSNARHRNLIRVIGCCTNMEFKALILEYMPNGSLEKWLYSENYCLDLLQRLRIAIDVALALEYLHHGHTFPIVHCDVKPSNVLLDEDMTARVADFGIAKLFDEGEAMIHTKTLATIGYAAPEYGSEGIVSTSADVYSYGVMLLEMFTRKKPTDDMFNEEMSLKEWVSEALEANAISQVLAPAALLSEEDRHFAAKDKCVASVFELAMKCLAISPDERINMTEAAAALKKIEAKVVGGVTTRREQHAITIT